MVKLDRKKLSCLKTMPYVIEGRGFHLRRFDNNKNSKFRGPVAYTMIADTKISKLSFKNILKKSSWESSMSTT